jgi:hypothetical protein
MLLAVDVSLAVEYCSLGARCWMYLWRMLPATARLAAFLAEIMVVDVNNKKKEMFIAVQVGMETFSSHVVLMEMKLEGWP